MMAQIRERPLDRLTQQCQGGEPTVEHLRRAQREVAGYDPDLIPAGRQPLAQVIDREDELNRVGAVHASGRIDRGLAELIYQSLPKGNSARLLHVDEEVPVRLIGVEGRHRSTPTTSRTRKQSSRGRCG